jgi:hypothetical protein
MIKKGVLFLIVLVGVAAMNTGFFNKKIDMNFIKTPDGIIIMGNQDEGKVQQIENEITKLQLTKGTDSQQQALTSLIQQIFNADSIPTQDKKVIDTVVGNLKKLNGTNAGENVMKPKSGRMYMIQFYYAVLPTQDPNQYTLENYKDGYVPYVYLLPNDDVLLPMYSKDDTNPLSTVKVRLDEATSKYIDNLYNSEMKKK